MIAFDLWSPWALAAMISGLRVVDVSIGTIRTVSVVRGHTATAMALGFLEVTIWIFAVTPVITGVQERPILALAFSGGFALGNAVGIALERWLALGSVVVRFISRRSAAALSATLGKSVNGLAIFEGSGLDGARTLAYASCPRRRLPEVLCKVQSEEPDLFYVIERYSQIGSVPLPHPTGWRAVRKMK